MADDNDVLRTLFKSDDHLDDDGFTLRVIAKLPVKPRASRRFYVLLVATALSAVLTLVVLPSGTVLSASLTDVLVYLCAPQSVVPSASLLVVVLFLGGSLAFAYGES